MASLLLLVCSVLALGVVMVVTVQAQSIMPSPRTDPSEARALNAMFSRWGISANNQGWNISGELCSGMAVDATDIDDVNPGIKCDCSYSDNTTCHITALNLAQNNLTGPIPVSIRNLNRLQFLYLYENALAGEPPTELGLLTDLTDLFISENYFSGPFPRELGNLTSLERLALSYNNFSGPLPRQLGNLTSLERLGLGYNNFSGPLPREMGNLTSLEQLYLSYNNFSGSLPSELGNLSRLTIL